MARGAWIPSGHLRMAEAVSLPAYYVSSGRRHHQSRPHAVGPQSHGILLGNFFLKIRLTG